MAKTKEEFEKALGDDLMEEEASELLTEGVEKYSRNEEVVEMYAEDSERWWELVSYYEEKYEEKCEKLYEELEENFKDRLKEKLEEQLKEKQREIAKRMLGKDVDIKEICELTGLMEKEIEELK